MDLKKGKFILNFNQNKLLTTLICFSTLKSSKHATDSFSTVFYTVRYK